VKRVVETQLPNEGFRKATPNEALRKKKAMGGEREGRFMTTASLVCGSVGLGKQAGGPRKGGAEQKRKGGKLAAPYTWRQGREGRCCRKTRRRN